MPEHLLLTGATGLVGRYLLKDLLERGVPVAVLIRNSKHQCALERLEEIVDFWSETLGRRLETPVCLAGDVSRPMLGLNSQDLKWVAGNCKQVLHNAAVLQFRGADRNDEPWRTNVDGTGNILRFCERMEIRDFDYVSTAYVCGKQDGPILESDFDRGQAFRNDYEHSKFLAESMVRENTFIRPPRIFRPAVITGDSKTGYTNTYHGIYVYMRLISTLIRTIEPDADGRKHTPFRAAISGDELRNVVSVDWVSKSIAELMMREDAIGETFHLTPTHPITARELFNAGYKYFNSYGVEYVGPNFDWSNANPTIFEQAYLLDAETYREYEVSDPKFDRANLEAFLPDSPAPRIDEEMLLRFWEFGEKDRWGKRKRRRARKQTAIAS